MHTFHILIHSTTGLADSMREVVNTARSCLTDEVNADSPIDCIIWKKASTAYKKQAMELDFHMRALLLLAKTTRKLIKQGKICM